MQTIAGITSKTEGVIRLILRVSNGKGGLIERNLLRLYDVLLMSHINYVASGLDWSKFVAKINTLMRRSIKNVLGLPLSTKTVKFMQLGIRNTISEVIKAQ